VTDVLEYQLQEDLVLSGEDTLGELITQCLARVAFLVVRFLKYKKKKFDLII